jgi:hypothetical protein
VDDHAHMLIFALRAAGLPRLVQATAAAAGQRSAVAHTKGALGSRRALVCVARALGFTDPLVAEALGCPRRTASYLGATSQPDPAMDHAVRLQIALESVCRELSPTPSRTTLRSSDDAKRQGEAPFASA